MGSALYGALLDRAARDIESAGACWDVLAVEASSGDVRSKALPLRLMAGVHRLVLEGRAPGLAAFFPSVGGSVDEDAAGDAFLQLVASQGTELRELVARRCQTNEVGRSAALVGGFLTVAKETGLPLRCLEIGASGGLNLRWDRYRYEADGAAWGDLASPVRFAGMFEGDLPFDAKAVVGQRAGCDLHPVDPTTDEGRLVLMSHVWADQMERFRLLAGAIEVARELPARVDEADAAAWLEGGLAEPRTGMATVVFHSIVMDQVDEETRGRVVAAIRTAGARATEVTPVAWLRFEHDFSFGLLRLVDPKVWLTTWPGGEHRLLARAGAHGRPVRWLG
jgi:hypothetical protein